MRPPKEQAKMDINLPHPNSPRSINTNRAQEAHGAKRRDAGVFASCIKIQEQGPIIYNYD